MRTAGTVLLVLAALPGTGAWWRRPPLRVRAALVLAAVLLVTVAFLLAAAATGGRELAERLELRVPRSARQALGWLLVAWLAAAAGGPFAELVLRMADGRLFVQALRHGDGWGRPVEGRQAELEATQDAAAQDLRGGATIGVLERLAVAGSLLTGAGQGIALVVAVKALGRYPELRTAGASERFIIGTLASLLWAAAATGTGLLLG